MNLDSPPERVKDDSQQFSNLQVNEIEMQNINKENNDSDQQSEQTSTFKQTEYESNQEEIPMVDDMIKATSTRSIALSNASANIPDFDSKVNIDQISSQSKMTYSIKTFLKNEYFYARLIIIAVTMFLLSLSISYAIGNLLSLDLANISCDKKTEEEILQHSKENNLNGGDVNGCWRSKGFTVL